jgi:hypothetical protein
MIGRRGFLGGLVVALAAPAIIRTPGLLMPVRATIFKAAQDGQSTLRHWPNNYVVGFDPALGPDRGSVVVFESTARGFHEWELRDGPENMREWADLYRRNTFIRSMATPEQSDAVEAYQKANSAPC